MQTSNIFSSKQLEEDREYNYKRVGRIRATPSLKKQRVIKTFIAHEVATSICSWDC